MTAHVDVPVVCRLGGVQLVAIAPQHVPLQLHFQLVRVGAVQGMMHCSQFSGGSLASCCAAWGAVGCVAA